MDNIDKLFKEKLRNNSIKPSSDLWNKIDVQLSNGKRNSNKIFYFKLAAGFAIIIALLYPISSNVDVNNNTTLSPYKATETISTVKTMRTSSPISSQKSKIINTKSVITKNSQGINQVKTMHASSQLASSQKSKILNTKSVIALNSQGINRVKTMRASSQLASPSITKINKTKESNFIQTSKQWIKIEVNISPEQLLSMAENENEKGLAELYTGKLLNKIEKETSNFITENNLPVTKNDLIKIIKK
ncbi:MAG: hypothetical protein ABFR62_02260 [Bacteroidota bacterium]